MYHDQNKHTGALSFTSSFVNTGDVFILPSRFIYHSGLHCVRFTVLPGVMTSQFSNEQTPICFINPLAWVLGDVLVFSTKGSEDSVSSPKAKF